MSNPFVLIQAFLFLFVAFSGVVFGASADDWRGRAIYQIITDRFALPDGSSPECNTADKKYCGGNWRGIINKLDYIQGMGFTAIWISPVITGIDGSSAGENYHGFWQKDLTTLNQHFGTPDDLKALSKAVHDRGMYLMIDVLANNMAWPGPGASVDYTSFSAPFNDKSMFHDFCYISDYNNEQNYQQCWLGNDQVSLPDIKTESTQVRSYFKSWASQLIHDYSLDGFRVDATKHVHKDFWNELQQNISNTYSIGEVFTEVPKDACDYMVDGLDAVLNYPLLYRIVEVFAHNDRPASTVQGTLNDLKYNCSDTTLMGTFTENHDLPRFASAVGDLSNRKNAIVFAMLGDGIPIGYYGQEQQFDGGNDPANREPLWKSGYDTSAPLYELMKRVNFARNAMVNGATNPSYSGYWKHKSKIIMSDDNVVATRKGYDTSIVSLVTNKGSGAGTFGNIQLNDTNWKANSELVEVISCNTGKTTDYGNFVTSLTGGEPQVWIPKYLLGNNITQICPNVKPTTSETTAGASVARPHLFAFGSCIAIALASILL